LAAFVSIVTGCAGSVLIRPDDAPFQAAQDHLGRTAVLIDQVDPPPAERWLFLQAESYYRYRFEFPPRSAVTYVAQAAAATTDFPAFQALAGSLDLLDLRLKSYDGAVQIWETLLTRYPHSRLRPLTLYRLGWAYRSSGVAGFPRGSGDEAFDLLAKEGPGSKLALLATDAKATPWKSKGTATGLSVVPGLGQFYVGERLNGAVRLAVALAAVAMVVLPSVVAYQRRSDLSWGRDWPLFATGLGGLIVLNIDYTTAYEDALRGVVQWNERIESRFVDVHPGSP
jgi:hypothetical protein